MNTRERVLARREIIRNEVINSDGVTTKYLANELGVSTATIVNDIKTMSDLHWRDCKVYCGERL